MKITCNVIEDLLPLYADDVLSNDSRQLVDVHLKTCYKCQNELRKTKDDILSPVSDQANDAHPDDEWKALRNLKHKIRSRRILTAVVVAVVVFFAAIGFDQYYYFYERYVPFEKSGLYIEDNKLFCTRSTDGRLKAYLSPDQTVEFICMGESLYARRTYKETDMIHLVRDFDEIWTGESEGMGTAVTDELKKVYYLPKDQIDEIGEAWNAVQPAQATEIIRGVEEKSVLLWERQ